VNKEQKALWEIKARRVTKAYLDLKDYRVTTDPKARLDRRAKRVQMDRKATIRKYREKR
jgi:hypothetical protein